MIQRWMVGKCKRPFQKRRSSTCMLNAVIRLIWASRNTTECLIPEVLLDTMCVKCLYKATTKTTWHEPAFSLISSSFSTCRPGQRKKISYILCPSQDLVRKTEKFWSVHSTPKHPERRHVLHVRKPCPLRSAHLRVIFFASKPHHQGQLCREAVPGSIARRIGARGQFGGSWLTNYFAGGLDQNAWSCFISAKRGEKVYNIV